jgi:FlaA1/EpsC-like NDP-sugar epimerase
MPTPPNPPALTLESLLGRKPLHFDSSSIQSRIQNKSILITGAAGSIGSELCRQIAALKPSALIAYDEAETPLFYLDAEFRHNYPILNFHPEIGDITRPDLLEPVFARHKPAIVFHAAAYKHVPMMELHPFAAVENNIFGTVEVARAAIHHNVEDFVLISSDKAVRPTSMMGATKRVAEIFIRTLQPTSSSHFVPARFKSVRFGNVLASSGSVIPIFESQIAAGGPVTVTHPEMRRYFMTIPEATSLVLESLSIGKGGEVFLLDMGQPIRILDLAEKMIRLVGFEPAFDASSNPSREIQILFTGPRPGEKLFEELNLNDEDLVSTPNSRIKSYSAPQTLDRTQMESALADFHHITLAQDTSALISLLKQLIPDYTPDPEIPSPASTK